MAEYELLFFLTAGELRAAEVCANGDVKLINFHGDNTFSCKGTEDIDEAYSIIADTYSVDELSELDAGFVVADCGADEKVKWHLLEKLHPCGGLNTVMLDKAMPVVLTKAGCCQAGKKTIVELFGERYAYICDDDCRFEEIKAKGKEADIVLDIKDFAFLSVFDGKTFAGGNAAAVEAAVAEKEAAVAELNQTIAQQREEIAALAKKLAAANQETADYKSRLKQKEGEAAKKSLKNLASHRRTVTYHPSEAHRQAYIYNMDVYINIDKHSGESVKVDEVIAKIGFLTDSEGFVAVLRSPRKGKIVWLVTDMDRLEYSSMVIAVVGDEEDDEDEMFAWGKEKQIE